MKNRERIREASIFLEAPKKTAEGEKKKMDELEKDMMSATTLKLFRILFSWSISAILCIMELCCHL